MKQQKQLQIQQQIKQQLLDACNWKQLGYANINDHNHLVPRGKVMSIVERKFSHQSVCGYIEPIMIKRRNNVEMDIIWGRFIPLDKRMPKGSFRINDFPNNKLKHELKKAAKNRKKNII